jgi:hypothetical protein
MEVIGKKKIVVSFNVSLYLNEERALEKEQRQSVVTVGGVTVVVI